MASSVFVPFYAPLDARALAPTSDDPIGRFRARVEELKETNKDKNTEEPRERTESTTKSRRHVRTAVRRLLTERLLAVDFNIRSNKIEARPDPGHHTPVHHHDARGELHSGSGSQLFSLGQHRPGNADKNLKRPHNVNTGYDIQSNSSRRPPPGVASLPRVDPVYSPVGSSHRTRRSLCPSGQVKGGRPGDVEQVPQFARQAAPKHGPRCYHTVQCKTVPGWKIEPHTGKHVTWHRDRAGPTLAYKLPPDDVYPAHSTDSDSCSGDLHLRRLLEELYRDKKYMDRLIDTAGTDPTEREVCWKLQTGRDYLLQRARFWLEKGPLPPRPPLTDLGLRVQRLRPMATMKTRQTIQLIDQDVVRPCLDLARKCSQS